MALLEAWSYFSIFLSTLAFTLVLLGGIKCYKTAREKDIREEKMLMYGYTGILVSLAIYLFLLFLSKFFLQGKFENFVFYADYGEATLTFDILYRIAGVFFYLSKLFMIFAYEKIFKKSKHLLTIIGIGFLIMHASIPFNSSLTIFTYLYMEATYIIILTIYAKKAKFEYKIITSHLLMAALCIGWSIVLNGTKVQLERDILPIDFNIFLLFIGTIFNILPLWNSPKNPSRALIYAFLMNVMIIFIQILIQIYYFNANLPLTYSSLSLIFTSLYFYMQFIVLKSIKSYIKGEGIVDDQDQ
jgi:hypothetical protein